MDRIGLTGAGNERRLDQGEGPYRVVITLKTADSQFIAADLNRQFVVPQHIWSKVSDPATFMNPNPVGSGPFTRSAASRRRTTSSNKNPHYWQTGARRSRASSTCRPRRTTPRSR